MNGDYYAILCVSTACSQEEIEAAYRKLAKALHPDVNPNGAALMQAVNEAHEALGDAKKRREYDRSGKVREFAPNANQARVRPAIVDAMNPDGSLNFVKLMGHLAPLSMRDSITPLFGALLEHVGVDPKAATVGQMLNAAGVGKVPKARVRRAG